jgi:hypothetical protein
MKRIFKYALSPGVIDIAMPIGAKVLTTQVQGDVPVIWALVDPTENTMIRRFLSIPTGASADLGPHARYVGTVQIPAVIPLVFHVFEEGAL